MEIRIEPSTESAAYLLILLSSTSLGETMLFDFLLGSLFDSFFSCLVKHDLYNNKYKNYYLLWVSLISLMAAVKLLT